MSIDYGELFGTVQAQAIDAVQAVIPIAVGIFAVVLAVRVAKRVLSSLSR